MENENDFNLFANLIQKKRMKLIERYLTKTADYSVKCYRTLLRYNNRHDRINTPYKFRKLNFKNCNDVIKANSSFHQINKDLKWDLERFTILLDCSEEMKQTIFLKIRKSNRGINKELDEIENNNIKIETFLPAINNYLERRKNGILIIEEIYKRKDN